MASTPHQPLTCADYTVACICPMGIELAPVMALLDDTHSPLPTVRDQNAYTLGSIGQHNVVVAAMPEIGNNAAATVATQLVNDFPSVRFALLVGVGGGVPGDDEDNDVRLGDVVVSQPTGTFGGVVQYDLGKALPNSRFERVGQLNKPPAVLNSNVHKLQAQHLMTGNRIPQYLSEMVQRYPNMTATYSFPATAPDQLFLTSYSHKSGKTCKGCDTTQTIQRSERSNSQPQVHYGIIGSANMVVKDPVLRDSLRDDMDVICVEMEAAGLTEAFPCLVIRGICDYADSHKNTAWQPYAAAVAAAYMKELLIELPPQQVLQQHFAKDVMVTGQRTHELLEEANKLHQKTFEIQSELSAVSDLRYGTECGLQCHQAFKTSPYEQFKNNNPDRVKGTCKWVLEHDQFISWQKSRRNDLLWISADPGCGKSVLAKSLIDLEFHDTHNYNVCYFFFKDNKNQDNFATALCAVLHQLFDQQPELLHHALPTWRKSKNKIQQDTDAMWRVFPKATADPSAKPTICIFDALDECEEVIAEILSRNSARYVSELAIIPSLPPSSWLPVDHTIMCNAGSRKNHHNCVKSGFEESVRMIRLTRRSTWLLISASAIWPLNFRYQTRSKNISDGLCGRCSIERISGSIFLQKTSELLTETVSFPTRHIWIHSLHQLKTLTSVS